MHCLPNDILHLVLNKSITNFHEFRRLQKVCVRWKGTLSTSVEIAKRIFESPLSDLNPDITKSIKIFCLWAPRKVNKIHFGMNIITNEHIKQIMCSGFEITKLDFSGSKHALLPFNLADIKTLTSLNLSGSNFNTMILRRILGALPALRELFIDDVPNDMVRWLQNISTLQRVILDKTNVEKVSKAMGHLKIEVVERS